MNRRSFLAAAAGAASLSGCTALGGGGDGGTPTAAATPPGTPVSLAKQGFPTTICEDDPKLELIPSVQEPAFAADWSDIDVAERYRRKGGLGDGATVVGLEADGRARAYPISVLNIHEAVSDTFGGPVLVTFCPLCGSGMVADRLVGGEPTAFGVSGLLWNPPDAYAAASQGDGKVFGVGANGTETDVRDTGNMVLYDVATGSFWSQIIAKAICGPLTGENFAIRPSTLTTWGQWKQEHPDTDVLLPPPHSKTGNPPLPE